MRRVILSLVGILSIVIVGLAAAVHAPPPVQARTASAQPSRGVPHLLRPPNQYPARQGNTASQRGGIPPIHGAGDLGYHYGPVEVEPFVYLIFWGAGWGTSGSPSQDAQVILQFWNDTWYSQYANLLSQYYQNGGSTSPNNIEPFGADDLGAVWDPSAPPTMPTTCPTGATSIATNTITDDAIATEVSHHLVADPDPIPQQPQITYFVYTPNGDAVSTVEPNGTACSGTQFCGYHSYNSVSLGTLDAYAAIPYPLFPGNATYDCLLPSWPSPNADANADALVNYSSHEWFEAATDPNPPATSSGPGGGWYHGSTSYEIGDECAYVFPTSTGTGGINPNGNTLLYNRNTGTYDQFHVQTEYSNATHDCRSYTAAKTGGAYYPRTLTFWQGYENSSYTVSQGVQYGFPGAVPLMGDWNGWGYESVGVYNPSTGVFYLKNSNMAGNADTVFQYGPPHAIPLAGDWNGDGKDTVGVYYPPTGTFYLRNSNSAGNANIAFRYGPVNTSIQPIVGDWNGDGTDTVGFDLNAVFYLKNTNAGGNADRVFQYGPPGATAVAGDFSGSGISGVGVFTLPSSSSVYPDVGTFLLRSTPTAGYADFTYQFGDYSSQYGTPVPIMGHVLPMLGPLRP